MQHSDERPPTSGRPSLLSLDQQAEAGRHRILGGLDSTQSANGSSGGSAKPRSSLVTWLAAGAAVLALAGGAGLWLASEGEKEIVAAGSAPLPATPAPAAPLAGEGQVMRGTAEDVSTAAILENAPAIAQTPEPAVDKKATDDELTKMLENGTPAAKGVAVPPMVVADGKAAAAGAPAVPPRAAKPVRTAAKAAPKKPKVVARPEATNIAPRPRAGSNIAPKKKADVKPAVPVDNDVALLAALVAHSKATQPKTGTGVAAKLKQCKSLDSPAEASQCRARICAGAKNEAACKS